MEFLENQRWVGALSSLKDRQKDLLLEGAEWSCVSHADNVYMPVQLFKGLQCQNSPVVKLNTMLSLENPVLPAGLTKSFQ
jgi:hypothetical protein